MLVKIFFLNLVLARGRNPALEMKKRPLILHGPVEDVKRARHGGKRKRSSGGKGKSDKGKKKSSGDKRKKRSKRKGSSGDKGNSALSDFRKKDDTFALAFFEEKCQAFKQMLNKQSWDRSAPPYHTHFPATEIPISRLKKLAADLVDFYSKRQGLEYELVEAVKGFSVVRDGRIWKHMNFKAKLKDSQSSDVKFFFGELDWERVPTCCIIDLDDHNSFYTKGCDVCDDDKGEVILHPRFGTLSMLFPPPGVRKKYPSIVDTPGYEEELLEAGGDVEKATNAQRQMIYYDCLAFPGVKPYYNPLDDKFVMP